MALRARLAAPKREREDWPWHQIQCSELPVSILAKGDRRFEAESYLAGGYGIRLAMERQQSGCERLSKLANIWQPYRLKGIQVSSQFGTPFLAATQVFHLRPTPRKFLSLERTNEASKRFVSQGQILVTCSGNVGRSTLAAKSIEPYLISHDLLRVEPRRRESWGWLYAYLHSSQARAMMKAAQYGHIIKHLEVSHISSLPVPVLPDGLLTDFSKKVETVLNNRNRAHELFSDAEDCFEKAIGPVSAAGSPEVGFSVVGSALLSGRRRLEGSYHTPTATCILKSFANIGLTVQELSDVTERVWWMTRFKRVFGDKGAPYVSSGDLFSQNPPVTKRVIVEQAKNARDFFVKAGIVMACSGQTYGLNGSVALMTEKHEQCFFSHDFVRIIPRLGRIRPGYLLTALGHPKLGRPLVTRMAYGTSIPHLDPGDVKTFPVVRLDEGLENEIADCAEKAVRLRDDADELENQLAADAEKLIDRFLAGGSED